MKHVFGAALAAAMALGLTTTAQAIPTTYSLAWEGVGNPATATGTITLDDVAFGTPGLYDSFIGSFPGTGVTDFSITVAGASVGNGTFGLLDFFTILLSVGPALDSTTEMVGQAGLLDFNFLSFGGAAPSGVGPIGIFTTASGSGDQLALTSFAPSQVPLPAGGLLLITTLGAVAVGRKARRC